MVSFNDHIQSFMPVRRIACALLIAACCAAQPAQAAMKEYVRDYNYHGTDFDTAETSRINAIDGVRCELLEEIGTYVGSVVKMHQDSLGNSFMSHDVVNITAGIVAMKVLEENWKQPVYFVKAEMKADPDDVLAKLKALRADLEMEKALRESYEELQNSRNEVAQLKAQLGQMMRERDSQAAAKPAPASAPSVAVLTAQYVKAVQGVEVGAAFQRAMAARLNGDFDSLFREMSALAEKGYSQAQFRLGWIYERGIGVAQDFAKAREWYAKAMANGNADALARMGLLYEFGLGVEKSFDKAAEYYQRAIREDNASGYAYMGYLYETGKGVPRDRERAAELYRIGMEKGNYLAMTRLGFLYQRGRGVPRDEYRAVELYKQAVEHGQPLAMARLGQMYNLGQGGVPVDHARAMALVRESLRYNLPASFAIMGFMYENGWEVKRDYGEARKLYEKAADLDAPFAELRLGIMYRDGLGVSRDRQKAVYWLERAASKGEEKAAAILERMKRW